MKTFFKIWIKANGEAKEFKLQSTKLKKIATTTQCGIYKPKAKICVSCYEIDIFLYLTHRVELCGTCGKPIKQKRYTLHDYDHEVYIQMQNNMLANVYHEIAQVEICVEEQDVLEDGVTINKCMR